MTLPGTVGHSAAQWNGSSSSATKMHFMAQGKLLPAAAAAAKQFVLAIKAPKKKTGTQRADRARERGRA